MKAFNLDKLFFIIPLAVIAILLATTFIDRPVPVDTPTTPESPTGAAVQVEGADDPLAQDVGDERIPQILLEEANRQGINATELEVNAIINGLTNQAGMTEEQYYEYVLTVYDSEEDFKNKIADNVKILKLLDQEIDTSDINITDDDVEAWIADVPEVAPTEELEDPEFKDEFYKLAKERLFENQKNELISEYVAELMAKYPEN